MGKRKRNLIVDGSIDHNIACATRLLMKIYRPLKNKQ